MKIEVCHEDFTKAMVQDMRGFVEMLLTPSFSTFNDPVKDLKYITSLINTLEMYTPHKEHQEWFKTIAESYYDLLLKATHHVTENQI